MNTIENVIVNTHISLVEKISEKVGSAWDVAIKLDGVGSYISLTNPRNANEELSLAIADDDNSEDLDTYRWQFWAEGADAFFISTLSADASAEDVLAFLTDCIDESVFLVAAPV